MFRVLCRLRILWALAAILAVPIVALPWGLLSRSIAQQQQEDDDDDDAAEAAKQEQARLCDPLLGHGRTRRPPTAVLPATRPRPLPIALKQQLAPFYAFLRSVPKDSRVRLQI